MRRLPALCCVALTACTAGDPLAVEDPQLEGSRRDPALFFPTAGQPAVARASSSALILGDGRVLVAGGFTDAGVALASSEVFDPRTDRWTAGPLLSAARGRSAATGSLVVGGFGGAARVEVDTLLPDAGFAAFPALGTARSEAAAVRLPSGAVLVAGGRSSAGLLASCELSQGLAWAATGGLNVARAGATATALADGRVLVAGGIGAAGPLASTEVRELDGGFRLGPAMAWPRARHTATLLPSGDVLLAGGDGDAGTSAEVFLAASGALRVVQGPAQPRAGHTATLLGGGEVLVAGGLRATGGEVYEPDAGRFRFAGCQVRVRELHVAAAIDGGVLLAFGKGDAGVALAHSERFVPTAGLPQGAACIYGCQCGSGYCADGVCCNRACNGACESCAPVTGQCGPSTPGTVCRPSLGLCDREEVCDGVAPGCPADVVGPVGVVCRSATGPCDVVETCTGSSRICPPDIRLPAGAVCRAPVAECDAPELCDGDGGACAADRVERAGTVCRPAAAGCDAPERCSGSSAFCPPDAVLAAGSVCRPAAGVCDVSEVCEGDLVCPPDHFAAAGAVCGGEYACSGEGPSCRTACLESSECASGAFCDGGACVPNSSVPLRHYSGFSCAQADGTSFAAWGALAAVLALARRRRGGTESALSVRWSRGTALALVALVGLLAAGLAHAGTPPASFLHTGTEGHQRFAIRVQGLVLKDVLSMAVGGEAGASIALADRFDLGAWLSIGRYPGARLGLTLHMRDDGERFRPFIQLRGLVHPVPSGVAVGAGLFAGVTAEVGPGRFAFGPLVEGYGGPPDYVPAALYLLLGYEWDVYRSPSPRQKSWASAGTAPAPPGATQPAGGGPARAEAAGSSAQGAAPAHPAAAGGPAAGGPAAAAGSPAGIAATGSRAAAEGSPAGIAATGSPAASTGPGPAAAPPASAGPGAAPAAPGSLPLAEPDWLAEEERTRIVTRIAIREVLTFGERQVKLNSALRARARRVAEALKQLPQVKKLEVAGHADDASTEARCLTLSQRRAEAVVEAMVKAGAPKELLVAKGYGRARPLVPLSGPARKREKNRRVDFLVLELGALPAQPPPP